MYRSNGFDTLTQKNEQKKRPAGVQQTIRSNPGNSRVNPKKMQNILDIFTQS